ncbi:MAG TPA: molybdopterin-dependent oxidoreductase [Candidatus Acidoferrales bacterium]
MNKLTRRQMIGTGLAAAAGATGLAVAAKLAQRYGLIPPDSGGIYGPGATLTYAAQRIMTRHTLAREFSRSQISAEPFPYPVEPLGEEFGRLQNAAFVDWRVAVDGLVARPGSFSLAELKNYPASTQITMIGCEEGWTYIAEWTGVPLARVLEKVGVMSHARYVVYRSIQPDCWDSIDMSDALHPQTLLCHGMNGRDLPVPFGGPLRMRVPRQLGYKNVKYINRLTLTDTVKNIGKGLGSGALGAEDGYAWYAGI